MIKEGHIGVRESVCMLTIAITCKMFYVGVSTITRYTGPAAWYMELISCAAALVAFCFIYVLLKRFPGSDIAEIFELSMGRWLGVLFSVVLASALLFSAGIFGREFAEVLKIYTLPDSPISLVILLLAIVVAILAYLGLETIARLSSLLAPTLLGGFLLLVLLVSPMFNTAHLYPYLGYGLRNTIVHGIMRSDYTEIIIIAIVAASLQGIQHIRKIGITALVASGVLFAVTNLTVLLVFSYTTVQEMTSPMYAVARVIWSGAFLQRLESVFLLVWCVTTFITDGLIVYAALSLYSKAFRIQDPRPLAIPMAVIFFSIALTPPDFPSTLEIYLMYLREFGWAVFYGLPVIALLVAVLRRKKGAELNA